jgi:hypothetical protein
VRSAQRPAAAAHRVLICMHSEGKKEKPIPWTGRGALLICLEPAGCPQPVRGVNYELLTRGGQPPAAWHTAATAGGRPVQSWSWLQSPSCCLWGAMSLAGLRQRATKGGIFSAVTTAVKTAAAKAVTERVEGQLKSVVASAAYFCGVSGMCGALLMFLGDVLLYGPAALGEGGATYVKQVDPVGAEPTALAKSLMGAASTRRTIAGGLLGPLAAVLYVVGCAQMAVAALPTVSFRQCRRHHIIWAGLAMGGHGSAMLVVGAYHAAFAYTGFIAHASSTQGASDGDGGIVASLVGAHMAYMSMLKLLIGMFGLLGTVGLLRICWAEECTIYPRRLLLFCPTPWLLLLRETGLLGGLPPPFGLLAAGGSFNIVFFVFFAASKTMLMLPLRARALWRALDHVAAFCGADDATVAQAPSAPRPTDASSRATAGPHLPGRCRPMPHQWTPSAARRLLIQRRLNLGLGVGWHRTTLEGRVTRSLADWRSQMSVYCGGFYRTTL